MSEADVITQAQPLTGGHGDFVSPGLPETIVLDMQGTKITLSRQVLLALPENVLFGISAGAMPVHEDSSGDSVHPSDSESTSGENSGVMKVDFNPDCFKYLLKTFEDNGKNIEPMSITKYKSLQRSREWYESERERDPDSDEAELESIESAAWLSSSPSDVPHVLRERPALIVLREDLEYFTLGGSHLNWNEIVDLKEKAGDHIASSAHNDLVFSGLRNKDSLDSPEYHLMQMLVLAGLETDQKWGFRERGKHSSRVLSLQLTRVRLPESTELVENVHALQKLLLFWRKPAKKCWWDKFSLDLGLPNGPVTVHARRVWTLELSILGLELY